MKIFRNLSNFGFGIPYLKLSIKMKILLENGDYFFQIRIFYKNVNDFKRYSAIEFRNWLYMRKKFQTPIFLIEKKKDSK